MSQLTYELPIPPSVTRIRWKGKNGKQVTDDRVKTYREDALLALGLGHITLTGPVKAFFEFFTGRDMMIIDLRVICDALVIVGLIKDETQVKYCVTKFSKSNKDRVLISIAPINGE